ncbi:MAG: PEP/pyruvate-binding domain-containing protein [Hyphomicrobium sp.]
MTHVFEMADATDVARVGGKAASLARLAAAGFPPPPYFAVAADAFDPNGLVPEAAPAFEIALARLGPGPYAVRSSGRQEDGAAHSHAGQFLSKLDVAAADVKSAAHDVWASGFTDTIAEYRRTRGIDCGDAAPAVIVQRMVPARAAGVAFSADPVSGRRDRVVISATEGIAERLVSGEIDGADYAIDKHTGAISGAVPGEGPLSRADVCAVADLALAIEAAFGAPQDIEWAFDGDRLHVLQARPITTPLRAAAAHDGTVTIFDNSNIVESYPGLVSPLTFSFAQYAYARVYRAFVRLVGVGEPVIAANAVVFENMLGRIDGRVYYNLVNWYRCLALLPGFAINRAHMETMMGVGEPLPAAIADSLAPPPAKGLALAAEWLRVGGMAVRIVIQALLLPRTIRGFYGRLAAALHASPIDLDVAPLTALAAEYRRIETSLLDRWDAPLVNDFLCMIAFGASRKLMQRWLGQPGLELHNDVLIGQGDIISAEPAQRIAKLGTMVRAVPGLAARIASVGRPALAGHPAIDAGVASYIEKFGDRCTEELKLESITLGEDPTQLLLAIAAAAGRPERAPAVHASQSDRLARSFAGKPLRRWVAGKALSIAKGRVRDRENLRFERTRIFGRARRVFLAMGRELTASGALEAPRDIFCLTVPEVLGAIEGFAVSQNLAGLVALRKAERDAAARRTDPPERMTLTGAIAIAASGRDETIATPNATGGTSNRRGGTGCSAGIVTGIARVVRDPRTEALAPGEILVARHTDPGWIAVFSNASAIVVERGSLLSHSAIVARELGIPCVVGLKDATGWISSGMRITVDGSSGEVTTHHG